MTVGLIGYSAKRDFVTRSWITPEWGREFGPSYLSAQYTQSAVALRTQIRCRHAFSSAFSLRFILSGFSQHATRNMGLDTTDYRERDGNPERRSTLPTAGTIGDWSQETRNGMGAGKGEIWLALGVISIPLVVISSLLLGIVFIRRVHPMESTSSALAINANEHESNVYYVRISSTTLVLLASFSSTISSILVGFIMTFLAYPISRHLPRALQSGNSRSIPRLYQLGLLISLLNASKLAVLWRWFKYTIARSRHKAVGVLNAAGCGLVLANVFVYMPLILRDADSIEY